MKLQIFRYRCAACRKWFEAPEIREYAYGEFLLRSNSGEIRYLNAILDGVFSEVDSLISLDSRVITFDKFRRAELLHDIFGLACDPDSTGGIFRICRNPRCPACELDSVAEWESTEPPRYIDIDVPEVSHLEWEELNDDEKNARIRRALNSLLLS